MLVNRLVVQKLKNDGSIVQSYTPEDSFFRFDFNYEGEDTANNSDIFPVEPSPCLKMITIPVGRETKYFLNHHNNTLYFSEIYVVPEGMMIAVILPNGYKPISMGFSECAHIPNGAPFYTVESPGYIFINHLPAEDIFVLYFNVVRNAAFKFSITAIFDGEKKEEFLSNECMDEFYDYTLRYTKMDGKTITPKDLQSFNQCFARGADLNLIAESMNRLMEKGTSKDEKKSAAKRISEKFSNSMSTGGDIATLLEYYANHKEGINRVISALLMCLQFGFGN